MGKDFAIETKSHDETTPVEVGASLPHATAEVNKDWVLVNPKIVLGLLGAVACYGWLFLVLGTSHFIPYADFSGYLVGLVHFCFTIGIAVSLLIVWVAADFFMKYKGVQYALAVVLTIIGCGSLGLFSIVAEWGWLSGFVMGCGFGFLYVLYGEYMCTFFSSAFKPYIYGVFASAIFVCAGSLFVSQDTSYWFALVFPVVAIVAYGCSFFFFKLGDLPRISKKDSDSRNKVTWRSYLSTATAGLAAGYALGCIISTQNLNSWVYIPLLVATLAVALFIFVDAFKRNKVNETVTMRWFLPFSAIIVFPLLFVPEEFRFVFAILLLCWSLLPICLSLSAICKHISICKLSPIRAFPFGRIMTFSGVALGFCIAFMGFSEFAVGLVGSYVSIASVILYMMLVIFSTSFVMTEDNYPDESRFNRVSTTDKGEEIVAAPGTPIRKVGPGTEQYSESEQREVNKPGMFYLKCEAIAKRYGLSSRQTEVLTMLAKGRNAEYITEKLVISSHTAKAHIYNIYQKTGVHSRQELMDLVEEEKID